ncbi:MAG: N-methyl-L-tryptophan oxidase [Chloroflexota bacterium]
MKTSYQTIVIGCGGIGSAAVYWLSRRLGNDVLGLEQFELGHHNGGSQDRSRIIRYIYHLDYYTSLMPHAYAAWEAVSEDAGIPIMTKTGGVIMAHADSEYADTIRQYGNSVNVVNRPGEWLSMDELAYRYPQFRSERELTTFYHPDSGLVDPLRGNACHIALARGYGATVLDNTPVLKITSQNDGRGVQVQTDAGTFSCQSLVIASGAWTNNVLAHFCTHIPLRVTQEQVTYYATSNLKKFSVGSFPVWQWKGDTKIYGFPVYGEVATKAAIDDEGATVTPQTRTFEPNSVHEAQLRTFVDELIPGYSGPTLYTKTCLYTMPKDRNFVLSPLPEYPNVFVGVGAGHGYKFASFLGKTLSELAVDGETPHDIAPLSMMRSAVADADYIASYKY